MTGAPTAATDRRVRPIRREKSDAERRGSALGESRHAQPPRATGDAEQLLALFVEPAPRFMAIVRATPELEIVYSRLPTACDRLDMVQFQKRG